MPNSKAEAQAALEGDKVVAARLAANLIKPVRANLVERPWGGTRIIAHKGVPDVSTRERYGEAFEIAADDGDVEARDHPSRIRFDDGSELSLPALLAAHPDILLGPAFVRRYGVRLPLLPKTLDIAELLSVQGHPEGNTEVYVIIDADPGATIRLGFNADVDSPSLKARLLGGRREQQQLLDVCGAALDARTLQSRLQPWFARRAGTIGTIEPLLRPSLADGARWPEIATLLRSLHALYWEVLDSLNEIPVAAGDVLYNANPQRALARGQAPSAEVHALGNPEGREILALEIRRPGPTFRAWDNVRFPIRDVDVVGAIDALNLRRTEPADFRVALKPISNRSGAQVSVDCEYFRVEHLSPSLGAAVDVPASGPHTLHAISGAVTVRSAAGAPLGDLERGESALVPLGVDAYRVSALTPDAKVVRVSLPDAL